MSKVRFLPAPPKFSLGMGNLTARRCVNGTDSPSLSVRWIIRNQHEFSSLAQRQSVCFTYKGSGFRNSQELPIMVSKCLWTHVALSMLKSRDRYPLEPPKYVIMHLSSNGQDNSLSSCKCRVRFSLGVPNKGMSCKYLK